MTGTPVDARLALPAFVAWMAVVAVLVAHEGAPPADLVGPVRGIAVAATLLGVAAMLAVRFITGRNRVASPGVV